MEILFHLRKFFGFVRELKNLCCQNLEKIALSFKNVFFWQIVLSSDYYLLLTIWKDGMDWRAKGRTDSCFYYDRFAENVVR